MKNHPANFRRQIIIDNNFLQYIDNTNTIPRNKEIIKEYVAGSSYKELSEKYGTSKGNVESMVSSYIGKVRRYLKAKGTE